jgi:hypothetical protein
MSWKQLRRLFKTTQSSSSHLRQLQLAPRQSRTPLACACRLHAAVAQPCDEFPLHAGCARCVRAEICGYLSRIIGIKLSKETSQLLWQLVGWLLCISDIDLTVWITHGNDVDARVQWL